MSVDSGCSIRSSREDIAAEAGVRASAADLAGIGAVYATPYARAHANDTDVTGALMLRKPARRDALGIQGPIRIRCGALSNHDEEDPCHPQFAAALLLSLFAGSAAAALPPLLADSAALDRSYIPALMLSNGKDPAKARAAQETYEQAWAAFAAKHRNAKPGDAGWTQMFAVIDKANAEARAAPAPARWATRTTRRSSARRHELHDEAPVPARPAYRFPRDDGTDHPRRRRAAGDGAAEIASCARKAAEARKLWQAVKTARWSPEDYGLDAARTESYRAALVAEDKALDELGAALDAGDGARILKAAPAIKPPFAKAYAAFGSFPQ
jgi:hypothetical protein